MAADILAPFMEIDATPKPKMMSTFGNARGEIAVTLVAVPEPAALMLLAIPCILLRHHGRVVNLFPLRAT
jgi:hypothetical protein